VTAAVKIEAGVLCIRLIKKSIRHKDKRFAAVSGNLQRPGFMLAKRVKKIPGLGKQF